MTFCYTWRTKKVHTHRGWSLRGPPNNYLPFSRYTYWSTDWVLSVPEFRLTFYQLNANSMSKFISQCPRPPPCCYLWAADSCLCCVMVFKVPVVLCTWTSAVGAGDWCGHTIMLLVWRSHQYPWPHHHAGHTAAGAGGRGQHRSGPPPLLSRAIESEPVQVQRIRPQHEVAHR